MRRYLFHLSVFHLQICDTKVSNPGCCLSAGWIFLAEVGAYRIPGYPHAYRCGRWRTMTRSRCLGCQELQLTANKLTPSWNCWGFFLKKRKMTILSIVCSSQPHVIHFHAICRIAVLSLVRIFSEKQSEPRTNPWLKTRLESEVQRMESWAGSRGRQRLWVKCLPGIWLMGCLAALPQCFHNLGWNPAQSWEMEGQPSLIV